VQAHRLQLLLQRRLALRVGQELLRVPGAGDDLDLRIQLTRVSAMNTLAASSGSTVASTRA
jgi:hypothetical protein